MDDAILARLPARNPAGHKGEFGHVLSICGSERYQGAAVLAALGAVHSGAGMVTAAFPRAAYPAIAAKLTVTPLLPLPGNRQGTLHVSSIKALREALPGKDAVLLGCGLGLNADTVALTGLLLEEAQTPMVLDADALHALASINSGGAHMHGYGRLHGGVVLTPHPGEMARLCGCSIAEIQENPEGIARNFAREHDVVLVLKGAKTIVANQESGNREQGSGIWICPLPPNSGLAKGGSGDLLAGMIASLLAQGLAPFDAAVCGVYLHALAAARAAKRLAPSGMTALDCIDELRELRVES